MLTADLGATLVARPVGAAGDSVHVFSVVAGFGVRRRLNRAADIAKRMQRIANQRSLL